MGEHRCQHLFEPGWTPPDPSDDEPCGVAAAAVLIGVAAVVIALVIATAVVAVAWALIGGAGGLAMAATTRPVLFDADQYRPVHISRDVGTHRPVRQSYCDQQADWWISPNEARRVQGSVPLCADCVQAHNAVRRKGARL